MADSLVFENVSKRFIIKHRRNRSFQQVLVNAFQRTSGDEVYWALRDLSLEIPVGETIGIIGENGSGKSTILKLVARILEPTSGKMTVNGRVAALLEIGAGFHPDLTGRDNIFLYGSIMGFSRERLQSRYDDIVEFAELGEFIDTPIKHYSSGMYMRLGFAVAINLDPEILLLDEVLAVGDERFQHKCFAKMSGLQEAGKTMILVSHDLDSVRKMCDRVLWLDEGRVRALGPAREVVGAYLRSSSSEPSKLQVPVIQAHDAEGKPSSPNEGQAAGAGGSQVSDGATSAQALQESMEARIVDIRFLDAEGRERSDFRASERMIIRISYHAYVPIEDPVFGVAIHTRSGVHVTGPNTGYCGHAIESIRGSGEVDCVIDSLPLLPGDYLVSASIHDRPNEHGYDWVDRGRAFSVVDRPEGEMPGLIQIPIRWEHRSTELEEVHAH